MKTAWTHHENGFPILGVITILCLKIRALRLVLFILNISPCLKYVHFSRVLRGRRESRIQSRSKMRRLWKVDALRVRRKNKGKTERLKISRGELEKVGINRWELERVKLLGEVKKRINRVDLESVRINRGDLESVRINRIEFKKVSE